MTLTDLTLLALASFRLTHLISADKIAEPLRRATSGRAFLSQVFHCYWCCGVWVSGVVILLHTAGSGLARLLLLLLAVAGGQALLETLVKRS